MITAAAGLWQNVLQPALAAVWGFLRDNVFPLFEDLAALLSDTFGPVIEDVGDFLQNTFAPALDGVGDAIDGVIGWIQEIRVCLFWMVIPMVLLLRLWMPMPLLSMMCLLPHAVTASHLGLLFSIKVRAI